MSMHLDKECRMSSGWRTRKHIDRKAQDWAVELFVEGVQIREMQGNVQSSLNNMTVLARVFLTT